MINSKNFTNRQRAAIPAILERARIAQIKDFSLAEIERVWPAQQGFNGFYAKVFQLLINNGLKREDLFYLHKQEFN